MGIRHLHTYISEKVQNGYFEVDIKKEVENWKRYLMLMFIFQNNFIRIILQK